jgi:predicted proteasome-type protease
MESESQYTDEVMKERRAEPRERVDRYFSVEFIVGGTETIYQFRIWDLSAQGMCVLVKKDSGLLTHLKVGQTLNMKYYADDAFKPADYLTTEIRHITKDESGRFKDHYLVGLSILGSPPSG